MATWHVHGAVTGGKYLGSVEAETKEEAEKKADTDLDLEASFCHHCSAECEDPQVTVVSVETEGEE